MSSVGQPVTLFLLLRAFSNGCTAMTGVEAVSNGVPAFKPPEAKNAAATMVIMAVLAITMFVGITLLAHAYGIIPSEQETVISQLARGVFEGRGLPTTLCRLRRCSSSCWRRIRRMPTFRGSPRFWRAIAIFRVSS
jgi:hypothetical protein